MLLASSCSIFRRCLPLQALDNLQCKRRVLLSGTPMQNHLDEVRDASDRLEHLIRKCVCVHECFRSGTDFWVSMQFYAMVNFCNPGVLGTPAHFRRNYEVLGPLRMPFPRKHLPNTLSCGCG